MKLKKVLFFVAAFIFLLALLAEMGSSLIPAVPGNPAQLMEFAGDDVDADEIERLSQGETPPGIGISYLVLIDVLFIYVLILISLSLFVPERVHSKIQGIISLIVAIVVFLVSLALAIKAFLEVILMLALFVAAPFGTIAYLGMWGFFPRGSAATLLSLVLFLKLVFAVCLIFAHPRFLQNKGLVLLFLTSLLGGLIVSFLHGFVPIILVSITDGVAAIINAILAIIWCIFFLIGAIVSIFRSVT